MPKGALHLLLLDTAQKMKFSNEDFFSKCDQTRSFLWIWSHLLKKSLMENFIFRAVRQTTRLLIPLRNDDELSRQDTLKVPHVRLMLITFERMQIKQ